MFLLRDNNIGFHDKGAMYHEFQKNVLLTEIPQKRGVIFHFTLYARCRAKPNM